MATVNYFLRNKNLNSKIQMQLSISRHLKLRTTTDLIIKFNDWSTDTKLPKQNNPENKNLSKQLRELSNYILNEYNSDYVKGILFDNFWLKEKINIFFNRIEVLEDDIVFINYLNNFISFKQNTSSYTDCTIRKYNNLKDRFEYYQKKKKKTFLIHEITAKVLIDFKNYLISECDLMETTAVRFIKNLKTVIFDAENNGKQIHHQIRGFSTGTTNTEYRVFLSFDEIEQIKSVQSINTEWNIARDWLVAGCYLGQRVSDLLRMNKAMIYTKTDNEGNSFRFIEIRQQKTGEKVVIPLHDEVETILSRYNGNFPPSFADNFDSNAVLFNRHIKKICELAGIHEIIKGKVYNEDKKKNEIIETEKCNLVSSHVCRRSFATNFYGNKMFTTPQLMAITGHKTENMFLNYIGKTADDWAMQTAKTFKELKNKMIS
ncbi:tyrosine-type recombinase/integrase [Elizabethkingia anophelis]|uniref:tyrosine-type recombinase/integrase n=1 Tax=Elizabethkingia anophelis TaxID=1117645 RepID=UPI0011EB757C|nr:tyrosine-type recombinase/integrase [Elizabethkingia anophelis]TYT28263.1 tyrosine-type recombinase/integrase [Elizabethkingia anophelis]UKY88772.1 site-specific integrase [Elizabethkingia anophelis]UKY95942.1 site-specific integrase [Elizabethkingia anophelis]